MKKIIVIILIVFTMLVSLQCNTKTAEVEEMDIALKIGSPLILNEKKIKTLDSENPNVVPVIHKNRTLVPLRSIAEHFGAEVSYDNTKREANR